MVGAQAELQAALQLLEAELATELEARDLPSLSVGVVRDAAFTWTLCLGQADCERQIESTPQTLYSIGSITKLFTATMVMQLRDAGKLQLDEGIEGYLPELRIRSRFGDGRQVTFRQALSHTAGLPKDAPFPYWETLRFPSAEELLRHLDPVDLALPPATMYKYSNLGPTLVGLAAERLAGRPYEAHVREAILRPLGMTSSGFAPEEQSVPMAVGYLPRAVDSPRERAPRYDIGALRRAGGMWSSAEELTRFLRLQLHRGPAGAEHILAGTTLREMHSPVWLDDDWSRGMGIGWHIGRIDATTTVFHGGNDTGFDSIVILVPSRRLGVAVLVNTNTDVESLAHLVLDILLPVFDRMDARNHVSPLVPLQPDWERYVGTYVGRFATMRIQIRNGQFVGGLTPEADEITLVPAQERSFWMQGGFLNGELLTFEVDQQGAVTGLHAMSDLWVRRE